METISPRSNSVKRLLSRNLKNVDSQFLKLLDGGKAAAQKNLWFFEIAWEVANQVGGINTVLRTKASISIEEMGDQYCMIGPYFEKNIKTEVELIEPPSNGTIFKVIERMKLYGFKILFGRWLIEGYPKVLLFDINSAMSKLDEWKHEIWTSSNIGIPWVDLEANNALVFGFLTATFLNEYRSQLEGTAYVVAHFHEWMAGIGLIVCRTRHIKVATIFTTHATMLGRHLCAGHVDFYNNIDKFVLDKEAGDRSIYQRYCIERAIVHCAHVFTTVSDITSFEAEHLLARKADLVLPNGLNVKLTFLHEFQNHHSRAKEKIHDFVRGHFYGSLDFDLDKTLYFFSSGRYEFTNKGADMFIEALARLNYYIKSSGLNVTIVAFLIFPTQTNNLNVESLRGQAIAKQLRDTVNEIQKDIGARIFDMCVRGLLPSGEDVLPKQDVIKLKRCIYAAQRMSLPPVCTHNVVNDHIDPILCTVRRCRLFNDHSDRVKVVFHPEFLTTASPILAMDYEEFVRGCNLGVFPSYYEPWGYTPAECTVMGIPSVSTNLCGFGCFMQQHVADPLSYGIYIVDRRNRSAEESIQQLSQYMFDFASQTRRQRIIQRNRTERLSELLDWKNLGIYYRKARCLALNRTYPTIFPEDQTLVMTFGKLDPSSVSNSLHSSPRPADNEQADETLDSDEERELLSRRITPASKVDVSSMEACVPVK